MNVALIENEIVVNVVAVESLELAASLFPQEVLDADTLKIGMGFFRENNKWYPPKPNPDFVWLETYGVWVSQEDKTQIDKGTLKLLSQEETDQIISKLQL